ncbi:MAG: DNA gyrase inhibitor YacG [Proteobacteria bacterium]|nr:DNA gyrase inhibitor YacG [Pseudomonadota bacterium]
MRIKCPTCKRELEWEDAAYRPFCSDRCRLVDLGAWLTEQRGIPTESQPDADSRPRQSRADDAD